MEAEQIVAKAVKDASPLTGWHKFPVFCNRSLIASMPTQQMQRDFIAARAAIYPRNHYGELPRFA